MNIPDDLKSRAIELSPMGFNELAWERGDAIVLLNSLRGTNTIILGGDVLKRVENNWKHNYDNWHFDPSALNSLEKNSEDSITSAERYIQNYPKGSYAFVLVSRQA